MSELPKTYQPSAVEPRITARWDAAGAFHADPMPVLTGEKPPFCIVIPPPNVTAALHLGHALNNTLQDVLVRAHRMMGYEALWMPGTDHAGIATQAVVEKRVLKEEGKRRQDFTREDFVARIQAFKDEYEATITEQLKSMGCSCDWQRQRFTMDPQCAAAVREAFFRLFRDGLIYRGKRLVNWDPALQTAVADDETYDADVDSSFWYLRYPVVSDRGAAVTWKTLAERGYPIPESHEQDQAEPAYVTVATTRPETYLGDTAVAMNPKDPRAKALRGLAVRLPLVGRVIPIVEDDYVVLPASMWEDQEAAKGDPKAQYATGFLKVTPAHDPNDYDLGQRHGLAMINVMAPDASISDKHGWTDVGEASVFLGMPREAARKKVVEEFKTLDLLGETRPYRHSVKHSDRSKAVIEPYLSDQWYVRVTDPRLAPAANAALVPDQRTSPNGKPLASQEHRGTVYDGQMRFYPARYAKTYETWHDNIRDWCISRQLWWGHRIPVWHLHLSFGPGASLEEVRGRNLHYALFGEVPYTIGRVVNSVTGETLGENQYDAFLNGELRGEFDVFVCTINPDYAEYYEHRGFRQDSDVLDTWFSSALWPLSTMGWPDERAFPGNDGMLEAFNPTSVLCTAREIITLWVSRMVMFNRYFLPSGHLPINAREHGGGSATGSRTDLARQGEGRGPVPFRDVFIHAMIQDGEGRKMSKMLGNGVDPRDIIESHGADAMRFTLVQMTTQTQDVRMPVVRDAKTGKNTSEKFDLGRNFCNKLWNTTRFVMSKFADGTPVHDGTAALAGSVDSIDLTLVDRWMLSRLAQSVRAIEKSLKEYQFSEYAQTVYDLMWRDFCDWYLEAVKPTVDANPAQRSVLRAALDVIVRLLHPIAPFITEAIHEQLRTLPARRVPGVDLASDELLCRSAWPQVAPSLVDAESEARFEGLRALITGVREVRALHNVPPKRRVTLHAPKHVADRCADAPGLVEALAGLDAIVLNPPEKGRPAVTFRAGGEELFLSNLADAVDAGAERERLTKQIEALGKSESTLDKRLSNEGYVAKAPPKLVEESKEQLAKIREELAALRAQVKGLG